MIYSFLDQLMEKVICDEFMGFIQEKNMSWNNLAESHAIKMLATIENVLNRRIPGSEKIYMITKIVALADK